MKFPLYFKNQKRIIINTFCFLFFYIRILLIRFINKIRAASRKPINNYIIIRRRMEEEK